MATPRVPRGLGVDGRRLWRDTVDAYDLGAHELALLDKAARTLDDVGRIEAALVDAPLVTTGSTGQDRAHPLLSELRGMRKLLGDLVRQLDLPDLDDDPGAAAGAGAPEGTTDPAVSARSVQARRAAGARHGAVSGR